jgi:hypothetical protein
MRRIRCNRHIRHIHHQRHTRHQLAFLRYHRHRLDGFQRFEPQQFRKVLRSTLKRNLTGFLLVVQSQ